jgi:2,3-bisphosphoglycerate-independent phosphoglycerate mutase
MKKFIICLGDGMADEPLASLGGKTPLQAANIPNMDFIAKNGQSGLVSTVPEGLKPGSDVANMGILGYDPRIFYTGRGPIEASSLGISVPEGKIAFRCNLVCIENDIMSSFTADHVTSEEGDALLTELNTNFSDSEIQFFSGVSYRNIALMDESLLELTCIPPHDISDQNVQPHLPTGPNEEILRNIAKKCADILSQSPINQTRVENGKKPANQIWLWGQGKTPKFDSFEDKYGIKGGIITAVDLLKGIGKLTGLQTPTVEGVTGFLDTNYKGKVDAALDILEKETGQFVYIHIEAPDEAGHMGDEQLKIKAIEDFDLKVVGPVLDYQKKNPDVSILVLPDHPTPCAIKTHTSKPVPWAIHYPNIEADICDAYDEEASEKGPKSFDFPWLLLDYFLERK